jgi:hypothetical protein
MNGENPLRSERVPGGHFRCVDAGVCENKLIPNVDKEKLKAAPGFHQDTLNGFRGQGLGEAAFTPTTATTPTGSFRIEDLGTRRWR